jgi:hypothetical protein
VGHFVIVRGIVAIEYIGNISTGLGIKPELRRTHGRIGMEGG